MTFGGKFRDSLVDEEGHRELVQLLDDQGVLEPAPEGHQVVGGDGTGDEQGTSSVRHERKDYEQLLLGRIRGRTGK